MGINFFSGRHKNLRVFAVFSFFAKFFFFHMHNHPRQDRKSWPSVFEPTPSAFCAQTRNEPSQNLPHIRLLVGAVTMAFGSVGRRGTHQDLQPLFTWYSDKLILKNHKSPTCVVSGCLLLLSGDRTPLTHHRVG